MITSFDNYKTIQLPPNSDLEKKNNENWNLTPLYLPLKDVEKANNLLTMISNVEAYTPCSQANIPIETVRKFHLLGLINSEFRSTMEEYQDNLNDALNKDLKMAKIERHYSKEDFIGAVALGVRGGWNKGTIPYIWLATIPIGIFLGGVYGATDRFFYQYTGRKINLECSLNRKEWLEIVSLKEKLRIENHKEMINRKVFVIKRNLEEIDENIVNVDLLEEIEALDKLFTVLSPNNPILIDGKTISKYLEKFNGGEVPPEVDKLLKEYTDQKSNDPRSPFKIAMEITCGNFKEAKKSPEANSVQISFIIAFLKSEFEIDQETLEKFRDELHGIDAESNKENQLEWTDKVSTEKLINVASRIEGTLKAPTSFKFKVSFDE